ncbi:F-box protein SKIP23-like [Vicia villosa]|uniref:F-box protein SKIP23-like n=1 Tax=Vicia villosa TaxID=3911 RepID=UPI00273C8B77|nr:F-box protein SKIP23-like [Vicia villosa]XP_058752484.1 F-box protein SKIP23-like [Vicia villosa]
MADWSHLPKDILQLISEKLNSDFYILRFRSVCSTWRLSIPKPHNHFPLKLPHFSKYGKLYNDNIFLIKPPVTPNQQTLRPWLVRISPTSTGKFNLWHPLLRDSLNIPSDPPVLDFNQLSVFNIGPVYVRGTFYPHSSCTSFSDSGCCVVTFEGEQIPNIVSYDSDSMGMVMFRCGGDGLTKIPNVAPYYQGMCIFKGRPCLTDNTGRTVMIGSDLNVDLVAEPVFDDDPYVNGDIYIMVENESDLLLVHKYTENHNINEELVRFDVFRLDQRQKKWLKLENLGDMVLFLGQGYSSAISASDLGFDSGNFVIYCNYTCRKMRVFPLDQQRTFLLSDYPDYLKLFWPPPEWIVTKCL